MKYKSELIKEIVDSRGHEKSSLHYESECVGSWIEETKGAYPKLCDYQSEWLNYIIENPIGVFPYEIITDVTEATVNNVVPYAYNRAILTGQTLVNQSTTSELTFKSAWQGQNIEGNTLQSGKKYFVSFNLESDNSELALQARNGNSFVYHIQKGFTKGKNILSFILEQDVNGLKFQIGNDFNVNISNIVILEHQEGMENWDIPFFTGVQSVQMPVLTTSNEDGTKTNILSTTEDVTLRGIGDVRDELDLLTGKVTERIDEIVLDGSQDGGYEYATNESLGLLILRLPKIPDIMNTSSNLYGLVSDKYASVTSKLPYNIYAYNARIMVTMPLSELESFNTSDKIKLFLSQNPITMQYPLATPTIKTVDLSIQDQDGNTLRKIKPIEGTMHIHSDGTPLKPSITMEIPVEATTQNLYSFIEEE